MNEIKLPPLRRIWVRCPHCGAKTILYDNTAECRGVYIKVLLTNPRHRELNVI